MPEHMFKSIEENAVALRSGKLSATVLAEEAVANHERQDPPLDAYKVWDPAKFKAEAAAADAAFAAGVDLGPLQGIPVSVKDLYGVNGYPTYAGAQKQLPVAWQQEGPIVTALRQSLAPFSGKTHTVEFAFGGIGTNPHWGTPRNPWSTDEHRVPGGSSAGAGVSLGEGSAMLALGSDTAGSVRIPASATGNVGIKTSIGRWSTKGIVPLSRSLDTAGILARTVADVAVGFAVIDPIVTQPAGQFLDALRAISAGDIRVGVCDWFFRDNSRGVAEGVQQALKDLSKVGLDVTSVDIPELTETEDIFRQGGLAGIEFAAFINNELPNYKAELDRNVAARFETIELIPAVDFLKRRDRLQQLAADIELRMADVDILVAPTLPITPPTVQEVERAEDYMTHNMAILRNTMVANLLELCAISIPVALDAKKMPVGLMIMGPKNADTRILAAAMAFEAALGTATERIGTPPILKKKQRSPKKKS